jgi:hypothetical protein
MKILDRQKIFTTGIDPFFFSQGLAFGTMPIPARVIGYLQMAAVVTLVLMAAKDNCSACLDSPHDP